MNTLKNIFDPHTLYIILVGQVGILMDAGFVNLYQYIKIVHLDVNSTFILFNIKFQPVCDFF